VRGLLNKLKYSKMYVFGLITLVYLKVGQMSGLNSIKKTRPEAYYIVIV
jgi:hypothetical protein